MTRFVFKDTETSGTDPRYDQILQSAAILTDEALNELDVIDVRCRRLPHIIPNPIALSVTNIDPWTLKDAKMSHFEMARFIHEKYSKWAPAIFIGHNTLGFDEEIERSMFWMNLLDMYVSNTRGSQRADTLIILRVAHALRPGLFKVQCHPETGSPIFKLDRLAPDNGFDGHNAHDALGDIRANIFVARLVKDGAPDIWRSVMANSVPAQAEEIVAEPLTLLMTHFGKAEFMPATRVAIDPNNKRKMLMIDLSKDFKPWLDKTPEELAEKMFSKESPFQTIVTNKMPTVFSPTDPVVVEKWQEVTAHINDLQERRFDIMQHPTFKANCEKAMQLKKDSFETSDAIEEQLYGAFVSRNDKDRMAAFHRHPDWKERQSTASVWAMENADKRLHKIAQRLFWSEAPHLLTPDVLQAIDDRTVAMRILGPSTDANGKPVKWTTLEAARADLPQIEGKPLYEKIKSWYDALEAAVRANPAAIRTFDGAPTEAMANAAVNTVIEHARHLTPDMFQPA